MHRMRVYTVGAYHELHANTLCLQETEALP